MSSKSNVEEKELLKEFIYLSQLINNHKRNTSRKAVFFDKNHVHRSLKKSKLFSTTTKPNPKKNSGLFITASGNTGATVVTSQSGSIARTFVTNAQPTVIKNSVDRNVSRKVTFQSSRRVVSSPPVRTVLKSSSPMKNVSSTSTSEIALPVNTSCSITGSTQNPYQLVKMERERLNDNINLISNLPSVKVRVVSVNEGDLTVKIPNKSKSEIRVENDLASLVKPKNNIEKNSEFRTRIVRSPNVKQPERLVLRPSQYKWNAPNKLLSNSIAQLPVQNQNTITTQKIRAPESKLVSNSSYKLVRNPAVKSNMHNKPKKTIKTKYKLIRKQGELDKVTPAVKTKYKLVNKKTTKLTPSRFVRKVGKYSIKYVQIKRKKNSPSSAYFGRSRKNKMPFVLQSRSVHKYVKNRVVRRLSRDFRDVSNSKPMSSKLVMIGGMLYKSSPNQLSRTDKQRNNKIKITTLTSKKPNVVIVRGVKFLMDSQGKTLKRVQEHKISSISDEKSKENIPKVARVDLGGKTYIQSEPGILVQSQSTHKRSLASQAVNRSINRLVSARKKSSQYCMFYNRFGRCYKKDEGKCPYIHDPDKIAVCTRFLKGNCTMENCPFSHKICRSKMPACSFFLRGLCNSDDCPYLHVNVNPDAETCQDFLKGYCPLGNKCKKHHRFSCPQFERTGMCDQGGKCPLKHIKHKPKKRKPTEEEVCEKHIRTDVNLHSNDFTEEIQDDEPSKKHRRLPSFIKLSDDNSESEQEIEPLESKPLRIKPQFLIK